MVKLRYWIEFMVVFIGNLELMIFIGIYKIGLLLYVYCISRLEKVDYI